jgi:hypothetical protein
VVDQSPLYLAPSTDVVFGVTPNSLHRIICTCIVQAVSNPIASGPDLSWWLLPVSWFQLSAAMETLMCPLLLCFFVRVWLLAGWEAKEEEVEEEGGEQNLVEPSLPPSRFIGSLRPVAEHMPLAVGSQCLRPLAFPFASLW